MTDKVTSITLTDGGSDYWAAPTVQITGGGNDDATAVAKQVAEEENRELTRRAPHEVSPARRAVQSLRTRVLATPGEMMGTANFAAMASKSLSPVTSASAWPARASARNGKSKGSRQAGRSRHSVTMTVLHQGR